MSKKKDKWYLPDEFKSEYWKGRGITQIVIGIGVTICGFLHKQGIGSVIFIIGGIAWTIFGIFLVARDSEGEQGGNREDENKQDDDDDIKEQLRELKEQKKELTTKIDELEQRNNKKGKR